MAGPDWTRSIVITGGAGLLGHALARRLAARGLPFIALDREQCDITREEDLESLFQVHRPSLLLNCAAMTNVDLCQRQPQQAEAVNGHAVGLIARLARDAGCQLVHFSTNFVFDGQSDRAYRTNDRPNPLSVYGQAKWLGEQLVASTPGLNWLTIRTAALFGPEGRCFPESILERARAGRPLAVVADQVTSPTYSLDAAEVTLELVERRQRGLWHMVNSDPVNWHEFTVAVLAEFGVAGNVRPVSTAEWLQSHPQAAPRPTYGVLDCQDLHELLGKPPGSWRQGLRYYRTLIAGNMG